MTISLRPAYLDPLKFQFFQLQGYSAMCRVNSFTVTHCWKVDALSMLASKKPVNEV